MNDEGSMMEGVDTFGLFRVIITYGEDRNKVIVNQEFVPAEDEKRALVKSKTLIPEAWDMDYVTINAQRLISIRVKAKPTEMLASK